MGGAQMRGNTPHPAGEYARRPSPKRRGDGCARLYLDFNKSLELLFGGFWFGCGGDRLRIIHAVEDLFCQTAGRADSARGFDLWASRFSSGRACRGGLNADYIDYFFVNDRRIREDNIGLNGAVVQPNIV